MADEHVTKYYYAGSQRIAMRKNGTLNYIIGDHLGSTSITTDASGNIINQTQYKAWCEERYSRGTKQTGYGYTGQYSYASDFGLHYYNARWYDSSLGRFTSADTIVPGGVQGYDRYAYSNNNPLRYTDPTGHMVVNDDGGCTSCNFPEPDEYGMSLVLGYANQSGGYMTTYAIAGIGYQNPWHARPTLPGWSRWMRPNTGWGPAKVSDNELSTPYGDKYKDWLGKFRGIGLGMAGKDQTDPSTAIEAMMTRIQLRTEACDDKCTSTDIFIAAAFGQNGPGFNPSDMQLLQNGEKYKPRPKDTTHSLDWGIFIEGSDKADGFRDMLGRFAANTLYLEAQGFDVPNDIDWNYVNSLTVTTEQP